MLSLSKNHWDFFFIAPVSNIYLKADMTSESTQIACLHSVLQPGARQKFNLHLILGKVIAGISQ